MRAQFLWTFRKTFHLFYRHWHPGATQHDMSKPPAKPNERGNTRCTSSFSKSLTRLAELHHTTHEAVYSVGVKLNYYLMDLPNASGLHEVEADVQNACPFKVLGQLRPPSTSPPKDSKEAMQAYNARSFERRPSNWEKALQVHWSI